MLRIVGLVGALVGGLAPNAAYATACEDNAEGVVTCEGGMVTGQVDKTMVSELNGYVCTNFTGVNYGGTPQGGGEAISEFTCATSGWATVRMFNTQCDIDFFVLEDTCLPNGDCIAYSSDPYNPGNDAYTDTFWCDAGRTYYIVVEAWGPSQILLLPPCPQVCVGGSDPQCTGGVMRKGSSFSLDASCDEVCDDGADNDQDRDVDCDDEDCDDDPACNTPVEDCEVEGDEDDNGVADCDDPACQLTDACCDVDGDGVFADTPECNNGNDCDDGDPETYLGAPEVVADGVDQDCDGGEDCYADIDGDDFGVGTILSVDLDCDDDFEAWDGGDCDDQDVAISPAADELPADGTDQDCDGFEDCWVDGDRDQIGGQNLFPSANLSCNSFGLSARNDDCDDGRIEIYPGADEILGDDVDQDCDTHDLCWEDLDQDGFGSLVQVVSDGPVCAQSAQESRETGDCLDTNAAVNVDAQEIPYDGLDNDCVGGDLVDVDGDGVDGGPDGDDCDDTDGDVKPGALELVADGVDQDCDGFDACYIDGDEDGVGGTTFGPGTTLDCSAAGESTRDDDCDDGDARLAPTNVEVPYDGLDNDCVGGDLRDVDDDGVDGGPVGTDCDDTNERVYPGATEIEDGIDQDCDGVVDEGTVWGDDDDDGFAEAGGDCADDDPARRPGAVELPNGLDDDCDGAIDEGTVRVDDDGDTFSEDDGDCNDADPSIYPGAPESPFGGVDANCNGTLDGRDNDGDGYAIIGGDCNDADPSVYPHAVETPNGVDDDCDGTIDETTRNYDDDRDGLSEVEGDCHDGDVNIAPNAPEIPNNHRDDDCDGEVDETGPTYDNDGDGYSVRLKDCDDDDALRYPGAPERPNGLDDDCDGDIDEGLSDADGDGFTVEGGDCDDTQGWSHPAATEVCDGLDNDCDGDVDEGCVDREPADSEDGDADAGGCQQAPGSLAWALLPALLVRRRRARARRR